MATVQADKDRERDRLKLAAAKAPEMTASRLRCLLSYNPDTGEFTLFSRRGVAARKTVGSIGDRCLILRLDYRLYKAHRLAWLYMTGSWPQLDIDHEDTNFLNNRWCNLREATVSQNIANSVKRRRKCYSKYKGVTWCKQNRRWLAKIAPLGKTISLGYFEKEEDAANAYIKAAKLHFGEFARAA